MTSSLSTRASPEGPIPSDTIIQISRNIEYPREVWYLHAAIIGLVSVLHWSSVLVQTLRRRYARSTSGSDLEGNSNSKRFSLSRFPLALVNLYRVLAFRCVLQIGSYSLNLAEIFLTIVYIVALFTWTLINTTSLEGVKLDVEYWSNRSALIASSQFPLIVALGTKNNVVSLLTGVGYEKLNYLHRMMARVAFILLWMHAGSKLHEGLYPTSWPTIWLRLGFTGLIAFTILILVSIRPIRAKTYELFFYLHFAGALIFLLGGYYHTREFHQQHYFWPCFLVWALDRFIRLVRVLYFIIASLLTSSSSSGTVKMLSPHLVRLRIPRPKGYHWHAGQTAYLVMPGVSRLPFEAHPFSIASIDPSDGSKGEGELIFLINARDGFTRRLADRAQAGGGKAEVRAAVLVEGPYGEGLGGDIDDRGTLVLIAGGTGVTHTLPLLLEVVRRVKSGRSRVRRVMFIWVIRDKSHLDWIQDTISQALALKPADLEVMIRVHITSSPREPPPSAPQAWDDDSVHSSKSTSNVNVITRDQTRVNSTASLSDKEGKELSKVKEVVWESSHVVQIHYGRPDLSTLLREEVVASRGCVTVSVCGSQGIASAVRGALRDYGAVGRVAKGGASVKLHIEAFGYA